MSRSFTRTPRPASAPQPVRAKASHAPPEPAAPLHRRSETGDGRPSPARQRPPRFDFATLAFQREPDSGIPQATPRPSVERRADPRSATAPEPDPDRSEPSGASPIPQPRTPSTTVPFRHEMEQAFGTSFASVAAHLGERGVLAPFGARAAAWSETVAFADPAPDRGVVAHELAHVAQMRRAGDGAPGRAVGSGHPAEREAAQIAAAVSAGAAHVRATAIPGGAVAFDRGSSPTQESKLTGLIEELKGRVAALESVVLTEEGRAETVRIVKGLLAQIDASHAVLSSTQQPVIDHARELVAPAQPAMDPAVIDQARETLVALLKSVDSELQRTVGFLPHLEAEFHSVTWTIPWQPQRPAWSQSPIDFIRDQVRWMLRALSSARALLTLGGGTGPNASIALLRLAGVRVSAVMLGFSELRPFLYYLQSAIGLRLGAPWIDPVLLTWPVDNARAKITADLAGFAQLEDGRVRAAAASSAATTQALFGEIPGYVKRFSPMAIVPKLPWQAEALLLLVAALFDIPGALPGEEGGFTLTIRGGMMPAFVGGGSAAVSVITITAEQIAALRQLIAIGALSTAVVSATLGTSLAVGVELPPALGDLIGEGPEATAMHETGKAGAGMGRSPRHHVMPQEERAWFEDHGMKGDLDIDQFTVEMDTAEHQAIHGGGDWRLGRTWAGEWNRQIMTVLRDAERIAGRKLAPKEILDVVAREMRRYGIPMDFVPYRGP